MQPSAHIQTAIELLDDIADSPLPADRQVHEDLRARRYAGSKDRAAISEWVFTVLRHRARFAWRAGREDPRSLMLGALLEEGRTPAEITDIFNGERFHPRALDAREKAMLEAAPPPDMPDWVRDEYPEWMAGELTASFGDDLPAAMAAMQGRASVDIRVKGGAAARQALQETLISEGVTAEPLSFSPLGLRLSGDKTGSVKNLAAYEDGGFEFQDEAAQIAAILCNVRPGLEVLDIAAGTGGKTLALADLMGNKGKLVASDIAARRLNQLNHRANKAGAGIIQTSLSPAGIYDRVLLDAPCSGSGTWRRQPELRWRMDAAKLDDITKTQAHLLNRAAGHVAPGGWLIYATCSVLPRENTAQIEAFLEKHPGYDVIPAQDVWQKAAARNDAPAPQVPGMGKFFTAAPHTTGTDGFFAAILVAPSH